MPGESVAVKIPVRRKAPDVGHTNETRLGCNDGTLTETDRTMEYRVSSGRWTGITGNTVKNLAPGNYEIRYAATDMDVASFIQKVTIEKGKDTGGTDGNGNNNLTGSKLVLLDRKDHMSYISGRTATQAAPQADITRAEVAAILARFCDTADTSGADYFTDISSTWRKSR